MFTSFAMTALGYLMMTFGREGSKAFALSCLGSWYKNRREVMAMLDLSRRVALNTIHRGRYLTLAFRIGPSNPKCMQVSTRPRKEVVLCFIDLSEYSSWMIRHSQVGSLASSLGSRLAKKVTRIRPAARV